MRIELEQGGLKCDNTECNWVDMSIKGEDYEQYINTPCTKCDENILTEDDFILTKKLYEYASIVNNMTEEEYTIFENSMSAEMVQETRKFLADEYGLILTEDGK